MREETEKRKMAAACSTTGDALSVHGSNETWNFTVKGVIAFGQCATRRYLYLYTFLRLALVIPRQQCCRPSCNTPVVPFSLHYPGTIIHVMISEVEGATVSLHSLLRGTWPLFSQFYENSSIYSFSLSQHFTKFSLFKEYLIEICNKSLRNAVT